VFLLMKVTLLMPTKWNVILPHQKKLLRSLPGASGSKPYRIFKDEVEFLILRLKQRNCRQAILKDFFIRERLF
jgi:hypothetical protein